MEFSSLALVGVLSVFVGVLIGVLIWADEVAAELGRTLDFFKVPAREKGEVLGAFAAHKDEVTAGYRTE